MSVLAGYRNGREEENDDDISSPFVLRFAEGAAAASSRDSSAWSRASASRRSATTVSQSEAPVSASSRVATFLRGSSFSQRRGGAATSSHDFGLLASLRSPMVWLAFLLLVGLTTNTNVFFGAKRHRGEAARHSDRDRTHDHEEVIVQIAAPVGIASQNINGARSIQADTTLVLGQSVQHGASKPSGPAPAAVGNVPASKVVTLTNEESKPQPLPQQQQQQANFGPPAAAQAQQEEAGLPPLQPLKPGSPPLSPPPPPDPALTPPSNERAVAAEAVGKVLAAWSQKTLVPDDEVAAPVDGSKASATGPASGSSSSGGITVTDVKTGSQLDVASLPPPTHQSSLSTLGGALSSGRALAGTGEVIVDGLRRMRGAKKSIVIPPGKATFHDQFLAEIPARKALGKILEEYFGGDKAAPERRTSNAAGHHSHEKSDTAIHPADIVIGTFYKPVGKFGHFRCDYGTYLHANRWRYASIHGYQYDIGTEELDPTRPLAWQKVLWVMKWLRKAKWVLMIDADALITGLHKRMEDLIDGQHDLIFNRDQNGINSGVALFRSSELTFKFLKQAYAKIEYLNHPWWEQAAFIDLLQLPEYAARLKIVPQRELNSYPPGLLGSGGWWSKGDFALHWPGSKDANFARGIENPLPSVAEGFPPCAKGEEEAAWERWETHLQPAAASSAAG